MFKVAVILRRNSALSPQEFIAHYEAVHAPLAAGFMPGLRRYTRHFLTPYGNAVYSAGDRSEIDVITEMWFDTEADFETAMRDLAKPEIAAALGADEERLFDRSAIRIYTMEDRGDPIT